jgi:hypothetical protein
VTRAPKAELIAPDGSFHSPVHVKLTFPSYGGVNIDAASLRVFYLPTPDVDITARIKPFEGRDVIVARHSLTSMHRYGSGHSAETKQ